MKAEEGKHYVRELPPDVKYPDDDPFILELKQKHPGVLWDRYIPSELAMAKLKAVDPGEFGVRS